jgi:hypothetical protein
MAVDRITNNVQVSPVYVFRGQRSRWPYPHNQLTAEYCKALSNVNRSDRDTAKRRLGYCPFNAAQAAGPEAFVGVSEINFKTHGMQRIEVTPTKVYTNDGTTRKNITGTTLTAGNDDRISLVHFEDKAIFTNGVDQVQTWDGNYTTPSTCADLTGMPFTKCNGLLIHKNLLVAYGTTESGTYHPSRFRWCDINSMDGTPDITNWPDRSRYTLYGDGPPLVGAIENFGKIIGFKEDGYYTGTIGQDDAGFYRFFFEESRKGIRLLGRSNLVAHPEFVFGLSPEGAFVVRPDLSHEIISPDVEDVWRTLNQTRLPYAQPIIREHDHQVRTLLSTADNIAGHDKVMVWDWKTNDIWFDDYADTFNTIGTQRVDERTLDYFGSLDGYTYSGNAVSDVDDNGTPISWELKLHPNDLGHPFKTKTIYQARIYYFDPVDDSSFNVSFELNQGEKPTRSKVFSVGTELRYDSGFLYDSGLEWPGGKQARKEYFVNRSCETIAPIIRGTDAVELIGIQYEYTLKE